MTLYELVAREARSLCAGRRHRGVAYAQAKVCHVAARHRIRLDMGPERSVVRGVQNRPNSSGDASADAAALALELQRLASLSTADLRAAWQAAFRRPAPAHLWPDLLLRILAWRCQERALGGHEKANDRLLASYGKGGTASRQNPRLHRRLKTGTVLVREFNGVRHTVTLAAGGFVWQDKTYASLSAIAKLITGTNWNGPRFFGLRVPRPCPTPAD